MKKTLIAMTLMAMTTMTAMAQRPSREDMQQRRTEMAEKQAERLAKDFDLKDDAKTQFIATYKAYRAELQAAQPERQRPETNDGQEVKKKKMTDEEAQKKVDEYFARQEQQIANQQKRLEVEKKFYAEFKKTLTPQQLAKVFTAQRQRQGGQQRPGGFGGHGGGRPGGFGGPGGQGGDDF